MEILLKKNVVAEAPARWAKQYKGYTDEKAQKTQKLLSLQPGFTAEEVEAIIGNKSWTICDCDECGKDTEVLVGLGRGAEWDCVDTWVCADCLKNALKLVGA